MRGRREIALYSEAVRGVLNAEKNAAKGHWLNIPLAKMLWLMLVEYVEVVLAVRRYCKASEAFRAQPTIANYEAMVDARQRVLSEVADTGAFGMFVADRCGALE